MEVDILFIHGAIAERILADHSPIIMCDRACVSLGFSCEVREATRDRAVQEEAKKACRIC
ncbi:MAG TPA: hypothetical protein V6C91_03245 [Coleofasciculaceae cyanobacterium]